METFSALLAICAENSPVTDALMFSLICAWINSWVNNREAGDLRRHQANFDVAVMLALREENIPFTNSQFTRESFSLSPYIGLIQKLKFKGCLNRGFVSES